MRNVRYKIFSLYLILLFSLMLAIAPMRAIAGDLESPAAPTDPNSAMYPLEDVYNRLNDNTTATKRSGAFTEPSAGPASTGHTLDQVYELALPTKVEKTGQTKCYNESGIVISCDESGHGQDGDLQKGVAWPSLRFTDNGDGDGDGTVTDNLTGLIWLKNANYKNTDGEFGTATWANALSFCNDLAHGMCGLTDGSSAGDWRLPNVKELQSLIDFAYSRPALSNAAGTARWVEGGDAFSDVQLNNYWSSTASATNTSNAWYVNLYYGNVGYYNKTSNYYVWPVRGGQ